MAKDPAFLFYPNDYIGGTMGMTFEEKGAYMDLLMMQFNRGHMTEHMIGQIVGQLWDKLKDKFMQDPEGLWYNDRLEIEIEKRRKFTESRRNNVLGTNQYTKKVAKKDGQVDGHMTSHMENENENKDELEDLDRGGVGEKELNIPFDAFWDAYKKKVGEKGKLSKKWSKLKDEERVLIMDYVPKYVMATPDKKFRKNPETFLNNKSWLDELPQSQSIELGLSIEERDAKFKDSLRAFKNSYDAETLNSFYAHWSERNETRDRMKFELESTWELDKRLFFYYSRKK